MKKILLAILVILPLSLAAQKNDYDVYLFIGQSNMAGRGEMTAKDSIPSRSIFILNPEGVPEPGCAPYNKYSTIRKTIKMQGYNICPEFGRIVHRRTHRPLLFVVNAKGGSHIASWVPGSEDGFLEAAIARTRQAMKYGTLKGILWHQGEGDSAEDKAKIYMGKLETMVSALRDSLGVGTEVPFIVGETNHAFSNHGTINPVLNEVPQHVPASACATAEKCGVKSDNVHFDRAGLKKLARRYAKKYLSLRK